jgi:hypothetical protein
LPAKHSISPDASPENVKMPHAVEQRKNQCLWADGGRKGRDGRIKIVSLAAEQDEIV